MTAAITLWLAFVLATGIIAWFGTKRQAIAFLLVAIATAPAAFITLGHAAPWQPPAGKYTVLGARIDVDEAIYVLLDAPGEPRFYKLPYSAQQASELQNSLDTAEANGTGVGMTMDGDAAGFAEEGGSGGSEVKQAEPQAIIN
ncbi:hypothetical protein J0664_06185 [Rhizobium leguminosarum]|uniref:hypothetical protein n=1 Tax=Rhizobium leguminosarum TaxID=384 RepID=UPI001A92F772|nr:hypothetical protein [Rhizobium leguminosarum]MBY5553700.1 hypothetical protein [Rhizobium leguminosarum]QSW24885.1 hypothetical protein J0664_06185 [Rhizobium leguminosarum]